MPATRRANPLLIIGMLTACGFTAQAAPPATAAGAQLDQEKYRKVVETLASDEMEGRGVLTEGNAKATRFLESEFKAAGLTPAGENGTFRQCFQQPVTVSTKDLALRVGERTLPPDALSPSAFSASGEFSGELVFAGYGIHAPELHYDDYQGLDPRDKVVVALRFEPQETDPKSPFNGDKPSRYSELRLKAFEAKERGAKALLLVAPPKPGEEADKKVPQLSGAEAQSSAGIPVLFVLPAEVETWLKARGTSLSEQVKAIDRDFASKPISLGKASGKVVVEREEKQLCNIVGEVPGSGALAGEAVVIGAHFDHLGYGQSGTMEPGVRAIHHGADDNASGTAGVVVLARHFASTSAKGDRRTILFVAFNGEEVGLAGSSAYVATPAFPLASTNAMINLDEIGRLRDGKLTALGSESGDVWNRWLAEAGAESKLDLGFIGDGYGPSDQTPFYAHGVPVLHFFTGAHEDYHRPSDLASKLNYPGAMQVLSLAAQVSERAARTPARIAYRETSSGPPMVGDSRGFDAYLGTIPDFSAMGPGAAGGVLISGVRKDSPADKAGLHAKDRIVKMAGKTIDNLYDMSFVLRDHRPGDVIEVVVVREGKQVPLAATLGSRSAAPAGGMPGGPPPGMPPKH